MEEAAEQPWDYEACRRRYVEGERIGLRELAQVSGVALGSLKRWSSQSSPTWPAQRAQFETEVRLLANQKSIELVSQSLAQDNQVTIQEHLRLLGMLREIASVFFAAVEFKVKEIEKDLEPSAANDKILEFLCSLGGRVPLAVYSSALHLAIQAERQALNMDLIDVAILEKAAAKHGLSLVDLHEVETNG